MSDDELKEPLPELQSYLTQKQLLASIVESSDDAIFAKDLKGTIISWNKGAERLYGYTQAEMLGQSVKLIVPKSRDLEVDTILTQVGAGKRVDHFETIRNRKDGKKLHVSLSISPIRAITGVVIGASVTARDLTKMKQLEQLKEDTIAHVIHDLKNHLLGQQRILEYIFEEKVTEKALIEALTTFQSSGQTALSTIQKLLEVNFVDTISRGNADFSMNELVRKSYASHEKLASSTGLEFCLELDDNDFQIHAVEEDIERLLSNILHNAVQFTTNGGRVSIGTSIKGETGEVWISDTGSGIPETERENLFDCFWKARTQNYEVGRGFGLYLCKKIADKYGANLTYESEEGKGTTFRITFPLNKGT